MTWRVNNRTTKNMYTIQKSSMEIGEFVHLSLRLSILCKNIHFTWSCCWIKKRKKKKKKKTMLSSESKIKNDDEKQDERRKARNAFNVLDYVGHCHNALYLMTADYSATFISDEHNVRWQKVCITMKSTDFEKVFSSDVRARSHIKSPNSQHQIIKLRYRFFVLKIWMESSFE